MRGGDGGPSITRPEHNRGKKTLEKKLQKTEQNISPITFGRDKPLPDYSPHQSHRNLVRVIETWLLLAVLKVPKGGDGSNIQYFQGFVGGSAI